MEILNETVFNVYPELKIYLNIEKLNQLLQAIMRISQCNHKSLDESDYQNAVKNLLSAVIG